jgi:mono/diheme cytochrome c family protein
MKYALPAATLLFCLAASSGLKAEEDDAALGARAFRACAACHSVEANRNMTGAEPRRGLESQGWELVEFSALFRRDEIVRRDLERQDVG